MDLGRGEREGEEGADSGSGGRASSGSGGVATLVHARGEGEREELLVDLWRGGIQEAGLGTRSGSRATRSVSTVHGAYFL